MEALFTATINVDNTTSVYEVIFDEEQYLFLPHAGNHQLPRFGIKREHDSWVEQQPLNSQLKTQAVNALENYLLSQH
ncbi:MAG TPA: hypothetical protein VEZ55_07260 [Chitinophagaceae bacterium]|nr:hypothetical protein [Chitinophagaceae bacterium]